MERITRYRGLDVITTAQVFLKLRIASILTSGNIYNGNHETNSITRFSIHNNGMFEGS